MQYEYQFYDAPIYQAHTPVNFVHFASQIQLQAVTHIKPDYSGNDFYEQYKQRKGEPQ